MVSNLKPGEVKSWDIFFPLIPEKTFLYESNIEIKAYLVDSV